MHEVHAFKEDCRKCAPDFKIRCTILSPMQWRSNGDRVSRPRMAPSWGWQTVDWKLIFENSFSTFQFLSLESPTYNLGNLVVVQGRNQRKISGWLNALLATIMTSSMCSLTMMRLFALISLPTVVEEPFS